jgi:hypothetical protein
MSKYALTCKEPTMGISELANKFVEMMSSSAELVVKDYTQMGAAGVVFIIFEKYFFRNNSYATLTVLLTHFEGIQTAKVVGSGGGEGLLNISWGANKSLANQAVSTLNKLNFS